MANVSNPPCLTFPLPLHLGRFEQTALPQTGGPALDGEGGPCRTKGPNQCKKITQFAPLLHKRRDSQAIQSSDFEPPRMERGSGGEVKQSKIDASALVEHPVSNPNNIIQC